MLLFLQLSRKTTKHIIVFRGFAWKITNSIAQKSLAVMSCSTKVLDTKYRYNYFGGVVRNCVYNEKLETGFKNAIENIVFKRPEIFLNGIRSFHEGMLNVIDNGWV